VLAAAVLALPAMAAHAQFGYNLGQRLGGPIVAADYSGYGNYGAYGGYSGGYNGYGYAGNAYTNGNAGMNGNYGYNLPRPIIFSGNGVDSTFGSQLSTNLNTNNSFGIVNTSGANQLINDPLSGFQQPRTIIDPFTGLAIQQGFNSTTNQFANGQYVNSLNPNQIYTGLAFNNQLNANLNTAAQRRVIYTAVPAQSMGVTIMSPTVAANQFNNGMIRRSNVATTNTGLFTNIPLAPYGSGFSPITTSSVNANAAATGTVRNNGTVVNNGSSAQFFTDIPLAPFGSGFSPIGGVRRLGSNIPGTHYWTGGGFGIQSSLRGVRR